MQKNKHLRKLEKFKDFLHVNEKSSATIEKYLRDVSGFFAYVGAKKIDKKMALNYKKFLIENYAVSSANSMIASLNTYFKFCSRKELCIKQFRVQKSPYLPQQKELKKEEYLRLVDTAKLKKKEWLSLIIQTICGTGIRISELKFITVEAVKKGEAVVNLKSKIRRIFIVPKLNKLLLDYAKRKNITSGSIFITRNKKPIGRINVWREMKKLCVDAGVLEEKVFPHNLRHLFARSFYDEMKDVVRLADVLGHSNINTTRIYLMTTEIEHKKIMEKIRLIR